MKLFKEDEGMNLGSKTRIEHQIIRKILNLNQLISEMHQLNLVDQLFEGSGKGRQSSSSGSVKTAKVRILEI
jgi:hypothetical protein